MNKKKIIKLSFIGGCSGGLEAFVSFLSSFIPLKHSVGIDFLIGGLLFTIIGIGLSISLIIAVPDLVHKKWQIVISSMVGSFLAGLFFHFGIGLYVGVIILSLFIAAALKLARCPKKFVKISLFGMAGGLCGVIISLPFLFIWLTIQKIIPVLSGQLSIVSTIIGTAIIIYFMNYGLLLSLNDTKT